MESRERLNARISWAISMFPDEVSRAALCYISVVGKIALEQIPIPGVIDDPSQIALSDEPLTTEGIKAHKRLIEHVARTFNLDVNEVFRAKEAILDACDPLPPEN